MPEEFFNSQDSTNQSDNTNSQFSVDANTISVDTNDTPHADSYSSEELADPNKIVVTIADKDTPIVLLIGPPCFWKDHDVGAFSSIFENATWLHG